MAVKSRGPFVGVPRDAEQNFPGTRIVYFGWDKHLLFYAPACTALAPDTTLDTVIADLLPQLWDRHPDFAQVDWKQGIWLRDGEVFQPEFSASLEENGIGHKTCIRIQTPGHEGMSGAGI